jgi:hypothetical protein
MGVEKDIAAELAGVKAAIRETSADPRIGWAWLEADYRASPVRAFHGRSGALTVEDHGMPALEKVMRALLSDQRVKAAWQDEDLWTTVLSLLAAASVNDSLDLEAAVRKLLKPAAVRIAAALSNVTWAAKPASLGPLVIAKFDTEEDAVSVADSLGLDTWQKEAFIGHTRQLLGEFGGFVLATATSNRQGDLAYADFNRTLEDWP